MDRRLAGGIVVAIGAVLLLVSALAEPIGLGDSNGFGLQQAAGVIIGAVVMAVGIALMYVRRGEAKTLQPRT
jgi:fumarate reductase subunit D